MTSERKLLRNGKPEGIHGVRQSATAMSKWWKITSFVCLLAAATAGASRAQTYTALYTFSGGADGGYPQYGGLLMDAAGNLYGTALSAVTSIAL